MKTKKRPARITRWEVEWQELTEEAKDRRAKDPYTEHDRDQDEDTYAQHFKTEGGARLYARSVVEARQTVYGHAILTKQEYLQIEGTNLFDWETVGEPEYIS